MKTGSMRVLAGLVLAGVCLSGAAGFCDVRLPAIISSGMVLQRNAKIPIWGWADPGERVNVKFDEQSVSAKANKNGEWKVYLNEMKACAAPAEMTVKGKNIVKLSGILVGDVWLCGGQSNMQWPTVLAVNGEAETKQANYPRIRLFKMPTVITWTPQKDTNAVWARCDRNSVPWFSAVGYFFGRDLHKHLDIPIGLIDNAIGATRAESWTSKEAIAASPYFKFELDNLQKAMENKDNIFNVVTTSYNGMCAPIIPFALKGVIWYQGESNAGAAGQYTTLMNTMIKDWRTRWENKDMPFLMVQLANFLAAPVEPGPSSWAELREAQVNILKTKNTGLALAIDIGEANDIHPKNKQDVAYRLFLSARKVAYKEKLVYSGPVYKSMSIKGDKIRIRFNHLGSGLVAKGGDLKQFSIAGKDQKFYWAKAVIDGNTVVVSSDQVKEPVAVRYAWAENPEGCNLYNRENLPAVPFRTDKWPGITAGLPKLAK